MSHLFILGISLKGLELSAVFRISAFSVLVNLLTLALLKLQMAALI